MIEKKFNLDDPKLELQEVFAFINENNLSAKLKMSDNKQDL